MGIDVHHGYSLRPSRTVVHDSIASDSADVAIASGAKTVDPAAYTELMDRLYEQAASKCARHGEIVLCRAWLIIIFVGCGERY